MQWSSYSYPETGSGPGSPAIMNSTPNPFAQVLHKDVQKYIDMDIDDLLDKLTPEEIEQLEEQELADPDNSMLPASDRVRDQTKKLPTGPYDRKKLMKFIECKAKEEKDWEEVQPFEKETRGKVWVPKEVRSSLDARQKKKKHSADDEDVVGVDLPDDYEDALNSASEAELVDLAGVLELHQMLTQTQYWASFAKDKIDQEVDATFRGAAKPDTFKLKVIPDEPPNQTNVDECLKKMAANDASLDTVNLNNMKGLDTEKLVEVVNGLKYNQTLQDLCMANVNATDSVAQAVVEALEANSTLRSINLESNFISPAYVKKIIEAAGKNESLEELRLSNQRMSTLGVQNEMDICQILQSNTKLLKLGLSFDVAGARIKIAEILKRNNDGRRKDRMETGNSPSYKPFKKLHGKDTTFGMNDLKPVSSS